MKYYQKKISEEWTLLPIITAIDFSILFTLLLLAIVIQQDKLKFLVPTFGFPEEHTHLLSVRSH